MGDGNIGPRTVARADCVDEVLVVAAFEPRRFGRPGVLDRPISLAINLDLASFAHQQPPFRPVEFGSRVAVVRKTRRPDPHLEDQLATLADATVAGPFEGTRGRIRILLVVVVEVLAAERNT